jgi:hypothetical protein
MDTLFREGLLRLADRSDQAVFELARAMGGGKTHLMVALRLLAKHPHLRSPVLAADLAERLDFGPARIAAFNGRNDPEHYIWGEIGEQLGKADLVRPYWIDSPLSIDEKKWLQIIGDEPTLILLDELPPYLLNAETRSVAKGPLPSSVHKVADSRKVELRCTPTTEMRYMLDCTNPKEGTPHTESFPVPAQGCTILVAAKAGEIGKSAKIQIAADGDDRVVIDDHKPARLSESKRITIDTTDKAFAVIKRFKERSDTLLRGVQIILGKGENVAQIRFNERELTAAAIETAIHGMREALGEEQAAVQVLIRGRIQFGDGVALEEFAEVAHSCATHAPSSRRASRVVQTGKRCRREKDREKWTGKVSGTLLTLTSVSCIPIVSG